ncbi:MAG: hypothetical protein ACREMZ_15630 [Gemmatimonadales bacterium]
MSAVATATPLWVRIAFLALVLGPRAAAYAQAGSWADLSARLDPQTAASVQSLIDSAAVAGVPGEPLVAKALEGQSKGATGERIILAVRNLSADLASARGALGSGAASSEIVAGAGALRSGASTETLKRLKAVRGSQSVLLPLATLTDLVARGLPVEAAAETVVAMAERGASEAEYRAEAGIDGSHPDRTATGAPANATPPAVSRPPSGVTVPGTPPPGERPTILPR